MAKATVRDYREALAYMYQYVGAVQPEAWLLDNLLALAQGKAVPHEWQFPAGQEVAK